MSWLSSATDYDKCLFLVRWYLILHDKMVFTCGPYWRVFVQMLGRWYTERTMPWDVPLSTFLSPMVPPHLTIIFDQIWYTVPWLGWSILVLLHPYTTLPLLPVLQSSITLCTLWDTGRHWEELLSYWTDWPLDHEKKLTDKFLRPKSSHRIDKECEEGSCVNRGIVFFDIKSAHDLDRPEFS